jgi:uncharacterized membrane protein (DUF2068 family)
MLRHLGFSYGVRTIALLEGAKALLVLMAGFGLLSLLHRDIGNAAARLVRHMHLNPAHHYPRVFLDAVENLSDSRLVGLASLALLYAFVRGIQAYGLWHERVWAEWFGVLSGAVYLPIEIYELSKGVTWSRILILAINICVIVFLAALVRRSCEARDKRD